MHRIGLYLCIAVTIYAVSRCDASPYLSRQEAAEDQKCKDLCGICNCIGFYCGDECICECNKRDDDDDDDSEFLFAKWTQPKFISIEKFKIIFLIKM